jgi:hypothetical protein
MSEFSEHREVINTLEECGLITGQYAIDLRKKTSKMNIAARESFLKKTIKECSPKAYELMRS